MTSAATYREGPEGRALLVNTKTEAGRAVMREVMDRLGGGLVPWTVSADDQRRDMVFAVGEERAAEMDRECPFQPKSIMVKPEVRDRLAALRAEREGASVSTMNERAA